MKKRYSFATTRAFSYLGIRAHPFHDAAISPTKAKLDDYLLLNEVAFSKT